MTHTCFSPLVGPPAASPPGGRRPHPALRVLVVEDDPLTRRAIADLLALEGFAVLEAATGEQGLARAGADHPDAVLLDLGLPTLSGVEVLRQLKRTPATRLVPVVVVSAYTALLAPAEASLADGLLEKPFCADALLDLLGRAVPPAHPPQASLPDAAACGPGGQTRGHRPGARVPAGPSAC